MFLVHDFNVCLYVYIERALAGSDGGRPFWGLLEVR
jgi:hypothetical protein